MPEITVIYRRTSRLSIRIGKRGQVRISAPLGTPKAMVRRFVEEHSEWIEKALDKTREQLRRREEFYAQLPLTTKQQKMETREARTETQRLLSSGQSLRLL